MSRGGQRELRAVTWRPQGIPGLTQHAKLGQMATSTMEDREHAAGGQKPGLANPIQSGVGSRADVKRPAKGGNLIVTVVSARGFVTLLEEAGYRRLALPGLLSSGFSFFCMHGSASKVTPDFLRHRLLFVLPRTQKTSTYLLQNLRFSRVTYIGWGVPPEDWQARISLIHCRMPQTRTMLLKMPYVVR